MIDIKRFFLGVSRKNIRMIRDVVTIDGPAGSGKSSVSRCVAARLGYVYLDTGAMYRAVALAAVREGMDLESPSTPDLGEFCRSLELSLEPEGDAVKCMLRDEDISAAIRTPEMDMLSSRVSALPEVREAMTDLQRRLAKYGRTVAEGRDMGTVVFPDARYKFYLTASLEIRAGRRYKERVSRGEDVSLMRVMQDLEQRDRQDVSRTVAPLRPAKDAVIIDTSGMSMEEVVSSILDTVRVRA